MSLIIPITAIFGAAFGSFLNVVILRYPHQSLGGRSRCPHCHRQLTFWDLIPVISWLVLRGRCRSCRAPVSIQYPIVELFGAASAAILAKSVTAFTFHPVVALLLFFIVSLLIVLFVIDLRTMLLPDIFIFILVGLALLILIGNIFATPFLSDVAPERVSQNPSSPPLNRGVNVVDPPDSVLPKPRAEGDKGDDRGFYRQATDGETSFRTLSEPTTSASRFMDIASSLPWALAPASSFYSALLGAFLGSGAVLILWFLTSGRGIGFGDVKLMVPLGLLFGPVHTVILLFSAFICGGFVGSYLLITKQATLKTAVPFGPFLAGVAIIFILFPQVPKYLLNFIV